MTFYFSLFVSAMTVVLLLAGALVTSTGSGLAVPDWPLSFGRAFPPMIGGVLFEHGHRMVAGIVAILTFLQCVRLWKVEERRSVRWLGTLSLFLVLVQALLGGATVLYRLPPQISIVHACLAQLFFTSLVVLTVMTSSAWKAVTDASREDLGNLPSFLLLLSFCFFGQLVLGAMLRHTGAALVIPDFPLAFGHWIPPFFNPRIALQFSHRTTGMILGLYILVVAIWVNRRYFQNLLLVAFTGAMLALVVFQVGLGATIIWARRPIPVTSLHLVVGALLLGLSVASTTWAYRVRKTSPDTAPVSLGLTAAEAT